jgi:hypothetical protein
MPETEWPDPAEQPEEEPAHEATPPPYDQDAEPAESDGGESD